MTTVEDFPMTLKIEDTQQLSLKEGEQFNISCKTTVSTLSPVNPERCQIIRAVPLSPQAEPCPAPCGPSPLSSSGTWL